MMDGNEALVQVITIVTCIWFCSRANIEGRERRKRHKRRRAALWKRQHECASSDRLRLHTPSRSKRESAPWRQNEDRREKKGEKVDKWIRDGLHANRSCRKVCSKWLQNVKVHIPTTYIRLKTREEIDEEGMTSRIGHLEDALFG